MIIWNIILSVLVVYLLLRTQSNRSWICESAPKIIARFQDIEKRLGK